MSWQVEHGDCLTVLRSCPTNVVDALCTDPPAGISFMGKTWDKPSAYNLAPTSLVSSPLHLRDRVMFITFMTEVMREALRLMKPGAHGLVWALPRTSHWTATALEDAGFEIRDVVNHLFGTGFPKSLNLGDGVGTALKPAAEHWILIRKPCDGTTTETFERWGTGGLEIDACRIGTDLVGWGGIGREQGTWDHESCGLLAGHPRPVTGRWPANVVLSHTENCAETCSPDCTVRALDEQAGERKSGARAAGRYQQRDGTGIYGACEAREEQELTASTGGASRFFYCAKPSPAERDLGLDALPVRAPAELVGRAEGSAGMSNPRAGAGRTAGRKNHHPTVKSIALMRWLIRLVTPPGGVVLDPFVGSGTTGCAAVLEGAHFAGIEQDPEYVTIARARIRAVEKSR